jgi:hypothetical protein
LRKKFFANFEIDSFALKLIAIVGMTADHVGHAFWGQLPLVGRCLLFAPGGLTFPIMAFLLAIGYRHTHDVGRYALRLLIFALISLLPYIWVLGPQLNVLFTLLLGLGIIWADDHLKNRLLFWALLGVSIVVTNWTDWSYIGVPMILIYHRMLAQNRLGDTSIPARSRWSAALLPIVLVWALGLSYALESMTAAAPAATLLWYLPSLFYSFIGASMTIPLIASYNGQRGRPLKYFFYAYYPAHIALIGLILGLTFGIWWS